MYDATWLLRLYARRRLRHLAGIDPQQAQRRVLSSLIGRARRTTFGRDHGFSSAWSLDDYRSRVPLRDYDAFWEAYWRAPFPRLADCTWPGLIPWFAVSSGTTTGTTKYIPVSREMHRSNARASADLLTFHLANRPQSRLFAGRVFMLGGSTGLVRRARGVYSGDLSGIAAAAMPAWARLRYFPPRDLESIADWQIKIDRFAERSLDVDISAVAGTPSWLLIYFERWPRSPAPGGAGRRAASPTSIPRSNCWRTAASPGRPTATASRPCSTAATPRPGKSIRRARGSSPSPTVPTARASGFCSTTGSSTSSSPSTSSTVRTRTAAGSAMRSRA